MDQRKRILIVVISLIVIVGVVLCVDYYRRQMIGSQLPTGLPPGSIPIYVNGVYENSFMPDDLAQLESVSFVDAEEGKTQEGWLLRDVLELYITADSLDAGTEVTVSSSSREKSQTLTWPEIEKMENKVMFDLSGRGTLKLVSKIPGFDIRDTWVQDVDSIHVRTRK